MRHYYNEFDKFAVAWLKQLIMFGAIPDGDIDERSITEVEAWELLEYDQCHFFAGIGGWAEAIRLANWRGPIWSGSCPCQPFSVAGAQAGTADKRHLWPEFLRLIRVGRPPVVVGEQVASKLGREWLAGVRADLEDVGYAVGAADLCAASVGSPHIRQRLYWVGISQGKQQQHWRGDAGRGRGELADASAHGVGLPQSIGGEREWLPDTDSGNNNNRQAAKWYEGDSLAQSCGAPGVGLQQPESNGREQRWPEPRRRRSAVSRCSSGSWLSHSSSTGLEIIGVEPDGREQPPVERSGEGGFWGRGVFVPCLDGKARRVEPGIFPLADGFPNRVGALRGSGNAIVPQVGAKFIEAIKEIIHEHS